MFVNPKAEIKSFECPITGETFVDPVIMEDGHTYERSAIESWITDHQTSPLTGQHFRNLNIIPNHTLRCGIEELARRDDNNQLDKSLTAKIPTIDWLKSIGIPSPDAEELGSKLVSEGFLNVEFILFGNIDKDFLEEIGAKKGFIGQIYQQLSFIKDELIPPKKCDKTIQEELKTNNRLKAIESALYDMKSEFSKLQIVSNDYGGNRGSAGYDSIRSPTSTYRSNDRSSSDRDSIRHERVIPPPTYSSGASSPPVPVMHYAAANATGSRSPLTGSRSTSPLVLSDDRTSTRHQSPLPNSNNNSSSNNTQTLSSSQRDITPVSSATSRFELAVAASGGSMPSSPILTSSMSSNSIGRQSSPSRARLNMSPLRSNSEPSSVSALNSTSTNISTTSHTLSPKSSSKPRSQSPLAQMMSLFRHDNSASSLSSPQTRKDSRPSSPVSGTSITRVAPTIADVNDGINDRIITKISHSSSSSPLSQPHTIGSVFGDLEVDLTIDNDYVSFRDVPVASRALASTTSVSSTSLCATSTTTTIENYAGFDVQFALTCGFVLQEGNTWAQSPYGPKMIISDKICCTVEQHQELLRRSRGSSPAANASATTNVRWRFKASGNSSWAVGIVPESNINEPDFLHGRGRIGLNSTGTLGGVLPTHRMHEKMIEIYADCMSGKVDITIESEAVKSFVLTDAVPFRLAFCGYAGTVIKLCGR